MRIRVIAWSNLQTEHSTPKNNRPESIMASARTTTKVALRAFSPCSQESPEGETQDPDNEVGDAFIAPGTTNPSLRSRFPYPQVEFQHVRYIDIYGKCEHRNSTEHLAARTMETHILAQAFALPHLEVLQCRCADLVSCLIVKCGREHMVVIPHDRTIHRVEMKDPRENYRVPELLTTRHHLDDKRLRFNELTNPNSRNSQYA